MSETFLRTTTASGADLLMEPLSQVRSCSVGFWVRRGSLHEGPEEEGLAHFLEHTVFKGTERYPDPEALSAAMDALGGHVDAFTGKETACFYGKVLREQLPDLVALLGDLVTAPRFDPEEVERERGVILEEIAQSEDQPEDWASELFYMNFWKHGPLAHPILGRPEQVSRYGWQEARRFFQKTYRAPNVLVAAAGDIDPAELQDLVEPILARLPQGPAEAPPPPSRAEPFLLNAPRADLQQASLVMGFAAPSHQHQDRVAVNLLSHILGGGMASRLFMELRERHALCYQIGSFLSHYRDTGALQITASCASDKARELVRRTAAECRRLAQLGATAEELERAKLQARTSLVFSQESSSARMFTLAHQAIHMDRIRDLDAQIAEIDAVDLDHVNRVAAGILLPEAMAVAALGTRERGGIRAEDLAA
ncbi:MAG: insulinase family protein [Firmicutes bacterium]|nr:insulinase family protein [Bacillota bacterium]